MSTPLLCIVIWCALSLPWAVLALDALRTLRDEIHIPPEERAAYVGRVMTFVVLAPFMGWATLIGLIRHPGSVRESMREGFMRATHGSRWMKKREPKPARGECPPGCPPGSVVGAAPPLEIPCLVCGDLINFTPDAPQCSCYDVCTGCEWAKMKADRVEAHIEQQAATWRQQLGRCLCTTAASAAALTDHAPRC